MTDVTISEMFYYAGLLVIGLGALLVASKGFGAAFKEQLKKDKDERE